MVTLLVATVVTGVLALVVGLGIARGIDWRSNEIFAERESGLLAGLAHWVVHSPISWSVLFVVLALGTTGAAIAATGGFGVSTTGGLALAVGPFALLMLAYLIVGTYVAARDRDVSPAGATLVSSLVVGALLLVAITAQLVV